MVIPVVCLQDILLLLLDLILGVRCDVEGDLLKLGLVSLVNLFDLDAMHLPLLLQLVSQCLDLCCTVGVIDFIAFGSHLFVGISELLALVVLVIFMIRWISLRQGPLRIMFHGWFVVVIRIVSLLLHRLIVLGHGRTIVRLLEVLDEGILALQTEKRAVATRNVTDVARHVLAMDPELMRRGLVTSSESRITESALVRLLVALDVSPKKRIRSASNESQTW